MIKRKAATIAMVAMVASGSFGASSSAHTGWSASGSLAAGARTNCGVSVTCQAFVLSGCSESLASSIKDGADVSIAKLPAGTAGHRARITWTSAAGPLGELKVQFLGKAGSGCSLVAPDADVFVSGSVITVNLNAEWVVVTAAAAAQVSWKIEGVAH